jgi:uncharacterized protein (TIGR02444 family)
MMDLKTFAVAVYSKAGVADACLMLQDHNQVDVPLLLFCGWYGSFYGPLQPGQLNVATAISKQLGGHVIKPLRQARRWMKNRSFSSGNATEEAARGGNHESGADHDLRWNNLREQIKSAELTAELLLLDAFENIVIDQTNPTGKAPHQFTETDIRHNLYMMLKSGAETNNIDNLLELISSACMETANTGTGQP